MVSASAPGERTSLSRPVSWRPADGVEQFPGDLAIGRGQLGDGRRGLAGGEPLDLHPQCGGVADDTLSDAHAGDAAHHRGQRAVGQRARLFDASQRADPGVDAVAAGHDDELVTGLGVLERAPGVVGLGTDGDDHLGEDDAGGDRKDGKSQVGFEVGFECGVRGGGHDGILAHTSVV